MSDVLPRVLDLRSRLEYTKAREVARSADLEDAEPALLIELGRLEEEVLDYDASAAAFERALATSDEALRSRAAAGLFRALRAQGRISEAQGLATAEFARAPDSLDLLIEAGELAAELDDFALADAHLQRAVASASDDQQRAHAIAALGNVYALYGLYDDAERQLRQALTLAESATGPMSIEVSVILNNLGVATQFSHDVREVQQAFERALAIVENALGPDVEPAATIHHNLGRVLRAQRDLTAALPHARRAVQIHTSTLGADHLNTALDKAALAGILDGLGEVAEAEALLRDVVVVLERDLGPADRILAVNLNNLAALVARRGDDVEAEALYRRSLAIKESILGPRSPALAATLNNLAVLLKRSGNPDEARELYARAIEILDGAVEPDHPILQSARANQSTALRDPTQASAE